jgi:Domain of unknown function (DUF4124)
VYGTSKQENEMALSLTRKIRPVSSPRQRATSGGRRAQATLTLALLAAVMAIAVTGEARAALYKWVDERGVVHYTDKMPPEAVDKGNVELNKQGVPINRTDKALTPEQRRANEQEAARAREAARVQEEIARRDRALVSSYTSEAEIDLARNRSMQTINNVILSSQAFSEQLTNRKVDVEAKKAASQGKPVVAVLDRELESIDAELARQTELIAQKKRESAALMSKYDADKQRWRELVAAKSGVEAATPAATKGAPVVPVSGTNRK